MAYRAGIHKGIRVDYHTVTPSDVDAIDDLTKEFKSRVEEECQKAFANSEVWKISL